MAITMRPVGNSYVLKDARLAFRYLTPGLFSGEYVDFSLHVSEVTLTPTAEQGVWRAIDSSLLGAQGSVLWVVTLGLVQDLTPGRWVGGSPVDEMDYDSLMMWLNAHSGETHRLIVKPKDDLDTALFCDVLVAPVAVGGEAGSSGPLATSVSLLVTSEPYWDTPPHIWDEETP